MDTPPSLLEVQEGPYCATFHNLRKDADGYQVCKACLVGGWDTILENEYGSVIKCDDPMIPCARVLTYPDDSEGLVYHTAERVLV